MRPTHGNDLRLKKIKINIEIKTRIIEKIFFCLVHLEKKYIQEEH